MLKGLSEQIASMSSTMTNFSAEQAAIKTRLGDMERRAENQHGGYDDAVSITSRLGDDTPLPKANPTRTKITERTNKRKPAHRGARPTTISTTIKKISTMIGTRTMRALKRRDAAQTYTRT